MFKNENFIRVVVAFIICCILFNISFVSSDEQQNQKNRKDSNRTYRVVDYTKESLSRVLESENIRVDLKSFSIQDSNVDVVNQVSGEASAASLKEAAIDNLSTSASNSINQNANEALQIESDRLISTKEAKINAESVKKEGQEKYKKDLAELQKEEEKLNSLNKKKDSITSGLFYSGLLSLTKSSLRNREYLKKKEYKTFIQNVGIEVGMGVGLKAVFSLTPAAYANYPKLGLLIATNVSYCYSQKNASKCANHILNEILKIAASILVNILIGFVVQQLVYKAISFGVVSYITDSLIKTYIKFF